MRESRAVRTALGAFGLTLVGASPPFVLGALAPFLLVDLGLTTADFGVGVATFFAASALSSFAGGALVQRLGPRRGMVVAAVLGIAGMLCVATWVDSFAGLVVALALAGASNGVGQPASNSAIALNVPVRRRALSLGIKQGAIPLGGALSGLSVPLLAEPFGWRWSIVAVVAIGAALVALTPVVAGLPARPAGATARRLPDRFGWLLAVAAVALLGAAGATSLGAFLVTSLVVEDDYSPSGAALLVMVGSAGAVAARIILGVVVDRFAVPVFVLIAGLLALSAVCFVLLDVGTFAVVLAVAAVLALLGSSGWQGLFQFGVVQQVASDPARATGVTQSGMFLGACIGPLAFGFISSAIGFGPTWLLLAVTAGLGAVIAWLVTRRARVVAPGLDTTRALPPVEVDQ